MRLNAKKLIASMLAEQYEATPEPGVYAIVNRANGRVYIGSAMNIRKRLGEHRSQLRSGTHSNPFLLHDWREHMADAFAFGPLLTCDKWDRKEFERQITAQMLGPQCYAWSASGQRSRISGHPAFPESSAWNGAAPLPWATDSRTNPAESRKPQS